MADAADSKSAGGNFVWVQVPSPAFGWGHSIGLTYAMAPPKCRRWDSICIKLNRKIADYYYMRERLIIF